MQQNNQPHTADSFATPADRRAYIAAQPDNRLRPAGAVPLATRLARAGRAEDLRRLIDHGMVRWPASWLAANDNRKASEDPGDDDDADCVLEMRPSPEELKAAGKDGIKRNAKGHITEWRGSDGKFRPVVELRRHAKGQRRPTAAEDTIHAARHLSLRGVGTLPTAMPRDSRYGSDGKAYWRLRHAYMLLAMNDGNDARRCCWQ